MDFECYYLTLQEEEVKEIYTDRILNPESKIAGIKSKASPLDNVIAIKKDKVQLQEENAGLKRRLLNKI